MTDVNSSNFNKTRLIIGGLIFVIGILSPILIPFVAKTNLSTGLKTGISGLLAFGIPEIFMVIAVAIMGKDGYSFLKEKILVKLKIVAPADTVSVNRYRLGLVMFSLPLVLALLQPYIDAFIHIPYQLPAWSFIVSDIIFIMSFFVLGGNFWDKLQGLFSNKAVITYK